MISSDATWLLWAVLLLAAALGMWAERTRLGARVSGAVVTMATTFALSNLGIIPVEAPVYDAVWSYLVPLAIPLLLFEADLRRIVREAGPTLLAFIIGGIGTVLGTLLAFWLVPLGEHDWQMAAIFSATYIGGTMNYMGASEAVGLRSGDMLTAGIAADNLMMTLYFLVLFTMPSITAVVRWVGARSRTRQAKSTAVAAPVRPAMDAKGVITGLAVSALLCAAAFGLEGPLGLPGSGILILTALTVLLATSLPGPLAKIGGASQLGMVIMQIFFAAIGATANVGVVLRVGPLLFVFAGVILSVHLVTLLLGGRLLRLSLPEMLIASNANMGGPTTAAAMAAARNWNHLVIPAILCGTLGYATATFIGVALGHFLRG